MRPLFPSQFLEAPPVTSKLPRFVTLHSFMEFLDFIKYFPGLSLLPHLTGHYSDLLPHLTDLLF